MNPLRSAVFAVLALGPAASFAQSPMSDSDILNKIHSIDQQEIDAGNLAQKTSANKKVKKFADAMVKEHSKADNQVAALAQKKGIALTAPAQAPDPLAAMTGVDFDRGYATKMVSGHDDALKFLAQADAQTQDADVKKLVETLQPAVQHHKQMAEKLRSQLASSNTP